MIYLDNAATTKPCREAVEAAVKVANECFGNVSSLHRMGIEAEKAVNSARTTILKKLGNGAVNGQLFFTSGATESNNTVIKGVCEAYKRSGNTIITTAMEHPSVARVMDSVEKQGFNVIRLAPKDAFENYEEYIAENVTDDTILVSCMAVNNETGYKVDTKKLYALVKRKNKNTLLHVDGVQGFCKTELCGDFISLSAHKIHGLKGIGALYAAKGVRFTPLLLGGGQQKNLRSGTEAVEAISAFEAAVKAYPADLTHYEQLNAYLRERLSEIDDIVINSPDASRGVFNILSFSVLGVRSEIMLHFLEEKEIYVSSGSACSKGKISGVPEAFGIDDKRADSTLRVSFSFENTKEDIDTLVNEIKAGCQRFRRPAKRR